MDYIVAVLILIGIVLFLKNEKPEDSKETLLSQIKQINVRVSSLENEVRILKGQHNASSQEMNAEIIKQEQLIIPEPANTAIEKETEQKAEFFEEKTESTFSNIPDKSIKDEKPKEEFESFVASNVLNKIGAVALIIGMGCFLKYAFDQNWINPVVQIITGFVVSIGLLFGASHFNKTEKYKIFSQGIAGAGIAISYLTTFSAYSFYQLFSYPIAFLFMLITTVVAFSQSVKYDSIATAILGIIGGFLTPFIISSGHPNPLGMLTYLAFLNILVVSLLFKKDSWKILGIISLFITYLTYFSLHISSYNIPTESSSILFLFIIWALYFGFDILKIKPSTYDYDFLNIENGILFYLGVYYLYNQNNNSIIIATLLIGMLYLFSGITVYYKHNKLDIYLKQNFIAFAILFAIATNLATAGFLKPALFSIEAFLLLYFGTKLEKSYIQKTSATFFTMSYLSLLCIPQVYSLASASNFIPIFNSRDLTFVLIIGLTLLSVKILQNEEKAQGLVSFFRYSWVTLLFLFLSVEVNDLMLKIGSYASSQETGDLINFNKGLIQVIIWSLYSTKLLSAGLNRKIKPFTVLGAIGNTIAVIGLFAIGMTYQPIARYIPVLNLRFVTFILSSINIMYISKLLKKHDKCPEIQSLLDYAWGIILFLLVNFEIKDCFNGFDSTMQLTLSAGWLIYSILGMYFGIIKRIKSLRYISLFVLGLTVLKVFIFDLSFLDQLGRIISFISLGAILLMLSFFYQKYSEQIKKLINEDIQIK